jgi:phage terminase large subunit-like protein
MALMPWQRELVNDLFRKTPGNGDRQCQVVWLEAPRKAGKTTLAAVLMLYMLLVDEEQGAEIAICSSSTAAASICFNIARQMVECNADMSSVCSVRGRSISYKNNHARLVSLSSEAMSGVDLSMAIVDDVQHVTRADLHQALTFCMAARRNPIILYLASAGSWGTPAWDLHRHACSITNGQTNDPSWLVRVYAAGQEDDWTDPRVWKKAHPGLGVTISESFFRDECMRAMAAPGNVDAFRRSFLNVWTEQSPRWLDMAKWDNSRREIDWTHYVGRRCKIGLDLSATTDLTAIVAVFPESDGGYALMPFAFCPEEALGRRSRRDGVNYQHWVDAGFLTVTSGNAVDYAMVVEKILRLRSRYEVTEVLYDKWCASMLIGALIEQGIACTPVTQDAASLSPAVRELEKVVEEGRLRHDGNPVLRWCTSNTRVEANAAGQVKPTKRRSRDRIDLAAASLFAITGHLAERRDDHTTSSF